MVCWRVAGWQVLKRGPFAKVASLHLFQIPTARVFAVREGTGAPVHIYQGHVSVSENLQASTE